MSTPQPTNTVPPYVLENKGTFPGPYTLAVPASLEIRPDTATAKFDGTGASGPFLACLTFYGTNGERLARCYNPTPVPQGGVAEVTYIPPFGSAATSAATGGTTTECAIYAAPRVGSFNILSGGVQHITPGNWTRVSDPSVIFNPATNKVMADGNYSFVLEAQKQAFVNGTQPVMAALLWPQTGFPIQASAPTDTINVNGAAVPSWVGVQHAADLVVTAIYNEDSIAHNFVAVMLIAKLP
jgi:hypothetical protein